jgi:S-adenosylmethionine:tRNA ribosyltransferase-isomerase
VNRLITNFHPPASPSLLLVSAFGGIDNIVKAYKKAQKNDYRLFAYGDAMLIV